MRHLFNLEKYNVGFAWFILAWTVYIGAAFYQGLVFSPEGNVLASPIPLWGDWCAHFTMGSAMAYRSLILKTSPFLLNVPFHYPFLVNLISALLIRSGVSFFNAFLIPSFLMSVALVVSLLYFYRTWFDSKVVAILAVLLFLLNGGLGFLLVFKEIFHAPHFWTALLNPPIMATTNHDQLIEWTSVIHSMIIPQRSFDLGFPMAITGLTLLISVGGQKIPAWWKFISAAILLGVLPLAHAHSFGAMGLILFFWGSADLMAEDKNLLRPKLIRWGVFALLAAALALPLLMYTVSGGVSKKGFIHFQAGWYPAKNLWDWIWFWIKNWGLTPLAAGGGLCLWIYEQDSRREKIRRLLIAAPFIFLFLLMNLIIFQPWNWDNTKLLVWVSVGTAGCGAYFLSRLWDQNKTQARAAAAVLFTILTLSGAMDAYRLFLPQFNRNLLFSKEDVDLAAWARRNTPKDSIWLTHNQHYNWVYDLAGRQAVMTYGGWMWSYGYDFDNEQRDVTEMFLHPERRDLFDKYKITYIVIGQHEISDFKANPEAFEALYKTIRHTKTTRIFLYR